MQFRADIQKLPAYWIVSVQTKRRRRGIFVGDALIGTSSVEAAWSWKYAAPTELCGLGRGCKFNFVCHALAAARINEIKAVKIKLWPLGTSERSPSP